MSIIEQVELKSCPFCEATPHKGLVKAAIDQSGDGHQDFAIWCPKGHAKITRPTIQLACEAWNTRSPATAGGVREALDHLGKALYFGAAIHPDDRNEAFEEALRFYNRMRPEEQVDGTEHASLRTVFPALSASLVQGVQTETPLTKPGSSGAERSETESAGGAA